MTKKWSQFLFIAGVLLAPLAMIIFADEPAESERCGGEIELLLDSFVSHREPPARSDNPFTLKLAIRNIGFTEISAREHMETFDANTICVCRPDGSVVRSRAEDQIVRGGHPRNTKRGELSLEANRGVGSTVYDMRQNGLYLVWWESGKHKSNIVVFERDETGLKRLP